jgi:hypothetical protein
MRALAMGIETERKIGFIVEGDVDKAVVETLARRLLGEAFRAYAVRLGGAIAVRWAYSTVLMLLEEKHYQHVVLVLDADSSIKAELDRKRREIQVMLDQHDLGSEVVSVCLAVPEIEAWLLAAYVDRPEESVDPRGDLATLLQVRRLLPEKAAEIARELDIKKARSRSPSFDEFARLLEALAERLRQAPAA